MTQFPREAGVRRVEILELEMGGWPSAVMSATLSIQFHDGSSFERKISYKPQGLIYESFLNEIESVNRYFKTN